jgi:hypothetical protein
LAERENASVEPLCYVDDEPLPIKGEILVRLSGRAGRQLQLTVLRLLCPCRNICRDVEVWQAVVRLSGTHHVMEVRGSAHHALISLRERARIDSQAAELLLAIGAGAEQRRHGWLWKGGKVKYPKPVRNDVPTIIEMLASNDVREQRDALASLFRTDRHVARPVWREIERACESSEPRIRAKAQLASRRVESYRTVTAHERATPAPVSLRPGG